MSFIVYQHIFPNGKMYFGITSQKPNRRWRNGEGYNHNIMMYRAIQKYGWNNITHNVLYENLTKEQAEQKEIELISLYKSNCNQYGYNICSGGSVNIPTEETKKKIGLASKGRIPDEITRQKISKAVKHRVVKEESKLYGERNWFYGKVGGLSVRAKAVKQLDNNRNTIKTWASISDACRELGIKNQSINRSLHKRNIRAGGYYWEYATL